MKNLIEILTAETQSLKEQYIQHTEKWATEEFARLKKWISDYAKWQNEVYDRKVPALRNEFMKKQRIMDRMPVEIYRNQIDGFVANQIENAKKHYEQSIKKLAARVEKKELNVDLLKATTTHIGVNIDTTLTDGDKTVRAFTILAIGDINRPHYRYLIK